MAWALTSKQNNKNVSQRDDLYMGVKLTTLLQNSQQISKTHIYEGMNLYLLSSI